MSDQSKFWLIAFAVLLAFGLGGVAVGRSDLLRPDILVNDLDNTIQSISPIEAEFLALIDESDTAAIEEGHVPILHQLALLVVLQNNDDATQCVQVLAWYGMDGKVKGEVMSGVVECSTVVPIPQ